MAKVYFYKDSSGQTKASKTPVTSTGKSLTNKTSSVSSNSSKVSNVVSSKVESPKPVQAESTASQLKKQGLVGNVITSASGQKFYTSVAGQRFTTPEAAAQASLKIKAPGAFNPNLKSYGTTQAQQIREAYSSLSYNEAVEQKKYDDMVLGTALKQQRDVEAYNKLQSVQSKLQSDKYSGVSGAVNISNAVAAVAKGIATPEQKSIARQAQAQGLTQAPAPVRPEVTWQIPAREAGVALSKGDVIGGLSKLSYSGLTLVKETGDYVSKRGEIIKDYSGFKPANILQGGGLNTRTDVTLGGIGARGESLARLGVYVSGSAISGLGSIPSIIGGVGRETPSILTAGAMMIPDVATSFVKNPLGYTMKIGGKAVGVGAGILGAMGTSFVEDPFGFGGQYAGASIGFGLGGKTVGLVRTGISKAGTLVTPRVAFRDIASTRVESLYAKGNLKALQYSDVGIRNVDDLIAYPKTSQAAKYYAQITGKPLAKQEGVVVRVMTQRTEGIFGRLFGKKDLTLSKPYTQYEIGSIFSGGVEPTGFPIKGLVSGGTKYRFSLLPKKPVFYDPNILLIKTKIGSIVGKDSISLLKKYGYDLTKAPEIARQNIAKVLSGKRVLQTRQIKGLSQKELQKSLDDILVAPKLSSKKAYPTVSEVIGQQSEAELTFIRGTTLQKTGLTSLGQRITGRTATTQFPTGGGKSVTTDVELYKNLGLISKPKGASEFKIIDDIARAAREGYRVEKFVSPLSYESIASSYLASDYNVSYSPPTYSVPSVPSYSPKTSSSVSFIKDVQSYVPKPSSSSFVYPLNDSYSYTPRSTSRVNDYSYTAPSYTPSYVPPTYSIPQVSTYRARYTPVPSYNVSRYDYRQFYVPKNQTYTNKQRRYDFEDNLLKSRRKKYSSKGFSKLYTPTNIENVLLPTKVDWLKAIGVTKTKQPKIETFKSLTLGYSGLKKSAKIIGVRF